MIDSYVTVHFTDIEILHKNFFLILFETER